MVNQVIQTRISSELKQEAEALFNSMGLGMSEAIRMFLQQSINEGAIPFQPRARQPNMDTINAMRELDAKKGEKLDRVEDVFAQWRDL
ncbi:MAG: type II toxin-antitoxin system RelB/DinJ family antitoxin [Rickettsiales bacterium]